jgi:hypothetical protein
LKIRKTLLQFYFHETLCFSSYKETMKGRYKTDDFWNET